MSTTAPPTTQTYYDQFAATYEARAPPRLPPADRRAGAASSSAATARGRDVFEAGCGTGLLLREARAASRARRSGSICRAACWRTARARGLRVVQGSLTDVPLPTASFDLVYTMKVLAHVPPIEQAMAELARVVRPGGHLLLEFYNPWSLRYLAKRLKRPAAHRRRHHRRRRLHPLRHRCDRRGRYLPPDAARSSACAACAS